MARIVIHVIVYLQGIIAAAGVRCLIVRSSVHVLED